MKRLALSMKVLASLLLLIALFSLPAIGQGISTIYFADARESPGKVYSSDAGGAESTYFARPAGNLYTFSFHPYVPEKLYYVNANDKNIYLAVKAADGSWVGSDQVVYTHSTYIRDLEYFPGSGPSDLQIYFSESSGAGGDGKIYRLASGGTASLYYTVRLSDVDGYWAGDFIHDSDGNLYLSSGNRKPASIYKVEGGAVRRIYTSNSPITGMAYLSGSIFYANWGNEIHRLDLSTMTDSVFRTQPGHTWISDVGIPPVSITLPTPSIAGTIVPMPTGVNSGKMASAMNSK
jgi:hypothetical protein